ncbi:MAG: hypothetical protein KatS3mg027_0629 [Bacteroidia bacterium]|nr:MAG: hypothetical protein KatS3mg027_0629 [Bacteroidia bacterium]
MKFKYKFSLLLISFTLIFLFSCDIQKRLYRKGYYFEGWNKKSKNPIVVSKNACYQILSPIGLKASRNFNDETKLIVENKKLTTSHINTKQKYNKSYVQKPDSCGDKLLLKSGDEYVVKIVEISDDMIKYKRCDFLDGPLYTIHKSKVYMIQYSNGIIEHIIYEGEKIEKKTNESTTNVYSNNNALKKYPSDYWLTITLFIVGWFFGLGAISWYMALFYARKTRRIIQSNPSLYKGYFEMGLIMYFLLTIFSLAAILSFVIGIVIFAMDPYYPLASAIGLVLIIIGILLAIPLVYFFRTSKKTDF